MLHRPATKPASGCETWTAGRGREPPGPPGRLDPPEGLPRVGFLQRAPGLLPLHLLQALVVALALFVLMRFDVFGQMVTPHEPLAAVLAHKALLPRVSPQVSLQLVRPGEALPAEEPVAHERPLPRVPPQVRLQVRRFTVNLPAAGDVTNVLLLLPGLVAGGGRLTVRTPAPPAPPRSRERRLCVQQRRDLRLVLRKVRMSQNQAPLELEAMGTEGRRVADVISLLEAPPRNILPRVRGQLPLLLVHKAGRSCHETRHGGRDGGLRRVTDRGDVGGRAGGLHGAGQHLDRGEVIGVRGVRRGRERQFVVRAERALDVRGQLGLRG